MDTNTQEMASSAGGEAAAAAMLVAMAAALPVAAEAALTVAMATALAVAAIVAGLIRAEEMFNKNIMEPAAIKPTRVIILITKDHTQIQEDLRRDTHAGIILTGTTKVLLMLHTASTTQWHIKPPCSQIRVFLNSTTKDHPWQRRRLQKHRS